MPTNPLFWRVTGRQAAGATVPAAESHWTLPYESLDFALSRFEGRAGRVNPGRFRTLPDLDEVPVALKRRVAGFDDLIYTCGYAQHVGRKPNVQAILEVSDAQLIPQPPFYSAGFAVEITLSCFYDLSHTPFGSCRHSVIIGLDSENITVAADSVLLAHDPMRDGVREAG